MVSLELGGQPTEVTPTVDRQFSRMRESTFQNSMSDNSTMVERTPPSLKVLSSMTGILVALLATGAFALSFDALNHLAEENGVTPSLTWVWPLVLDGAIVVFSLSVLRASLHREPIRYPMTLVVIATMASVIFNVAHAPDGFLSHTMAAVPPVFLFLSFELLMRQLRSEVTRASRIKCLGELEDEIEELSSKTARLSGQVLRLEDQRDTLKLEIKSGKSASVRELLDRANLAKADKIRVRREKVSELLAQDLQVPEIAGMLGVSTKTVKRDVSELNSAA
ncbi:MAG: hypothetical protein CMO55_20375 [Verrucomicrobiales bacterium]|nr:hypothetical protein [Verrucomicrobiales bacterium]